MSVFHNGFHLLTDKYVWFTHSIHRYLIRWDPRDFVLAIKYIIVPYKFIHLLAIPLYFIFGQQKKKTIQKQRIIYNLFPIN